LKNPDFADKNWKQTMSARAMEVINDKRQKKDTRKMLPQFLDSKTAALINSWLDQNPNIDVNIIGL
jgi:hypothetical protein